MYGIINKAVEEFVVFNFDEQKWEEVKADSGIDIDYFISNDPYDDAITYKLAISVANHTGKSVGEVLELLGRWWILKTTREKYGSLLSTGGESLKAFLSHLPDFHTRVMLLYPKLTPPEFRISHIENNSVHVHYYSKREGLQEFVRGLLWGLSELYETQAQIELLQTRDEGSDHEVFKVSW